VDVTLLLCHLFESERANRRAARRLRISVWSERYKRALAVVAAKR
jgi:hypothetical protein